jgi:hypothetical protein
MSLPYRKRIETLQRICFLPANNVVTKRSVGVKIQHSHSSSQGRYSWCGLPWTNLVNVFHGSFCGPGNGSMHKRSSNEQLMFKTLFRTFFRTRVNASAQAETSLHYMLILLEPPVKTALLFRLASRCLDHHCRAKISEIFLNLKNWRLPASPEIQS